MVRSKDKEKEIEKTKPIFKELKWTQVLIVKGNTSKFNAYVVKEN